MWRTITRRAVGAGKIRQTLRHRGTIRTVIPVEDLVGQQVMHVTTSWHLHPDSAGPSLLHLWLHLRGQEPIRCHTAASGDIELETGQPHGRPYDMGEYGQVVVGPAPADFPLTPVLGQTIHVVRRVSCRHPRTGDGILIGLSLRFDATRIRILNLGDDLVVTDGLLSPAVESSLKELPTAAA